jgi:hypothetical protein
LKEKIKGKKIYRKGHKTKVEIKRMRIKIKKKIDNKIEKKNHFNKRTKKIRIKLEKNNIS